MKRLLLLTSVAAMIGMSAPAYADPPSGADADFIDQLKAAGLTFEDPAKAVAAAKNTCKAIDDGTPDADIQSNLVSRNPGLTAPEATRFMTLSEDKYCSKYLNGKNRPAKPAPSQSPSESPASQSPSESAKPQAAPEPKPNS